MGDMNEMLSKSNSFRDDVPNDWRIATLSEIASVKYGKAKPKQEGSIPVVGSGGIYSYTESPLVTYSTIIVGRKGSAGMSWLQESPCWPSDTTFYLEWKGEPFDLHYIFNCFQKRPLSGEHAKTTLPSIQKADLENYSILLPPLAEQCAIAHVLRTVQQAKEATEKVIEAAKQLKQSLMQHLFTYGPVQFGEADSVEVQETEAGCHPSHWMIQHLSAIADLVSGGTPSKQRPDFWKGSIPWVSPKDMKLLYLQNSEDHISPEGLEDGSRMVPAGSLFIVVRGMILAKEIPIALALVPMAFNQDMKAIIPKGDVLPDFLLPAISNSKKRLIPEIGTSAHGTRRLGTASLERLKVAIPPMKEQADIAQAMECIESKLTAETTRLEALNTLFASLLHALMTCQIRVHDLDLPELKESS